MKKNVVSNNGNRTSPKNKQKNKVIMNEDDETQDEVVNEVDETQDEPVDEEQGGGKIKNHKKYVLKS